MRAALAEHVRRGAQLTRSELEDALRQLVRLHDLPEPVLNAYVEGEEVDAHWPAARVVVEADGWEAHRDRATFARDRAKSNRLTLLGYRVLRFTHDAITHRPETVAAQIRHALHLAGRR